MLRANSQQSTPSKSIDVVRWLAFQGCAFRGHDETPDSKNRGNFLEMLKLLASYNDKVKVRNKIREDDGNTKFCIIVDEARDESQREQMTIILRFVDDDASPWVVHWQSSDFHGGVFRRGFTAGHGGAMVAASVFPWGWCFNSNWTRIPCLARVLQERFFDLVHVKDTSVLTLKNEIFAVVSHHCLDIQNIRGQGYDGANNMRGEWKGLQALFLKDCPYTYYVHYFAHRLQLALVATSREVVSIHEFFSNLNFIINVVGASYKHHDELQAAQTTQIAYMIAIDELESGKGANQIGTIKRADFQMQELDSRFGEGVAKLLALSSALDPKDAYRSFNIDDICCLAEKYYPLDFSKNEKINLRLIRLVLTLLVSTATSERAFSTMKIVKTRLRNKIEYEFLANNLVVYIEREIAKNFDLDSILDDFFY
ncbi:uncharacterized protein LOC121236577 [Juglans microcarpa x Juglans regia]|uniref:uncharacterized protein LOC121236577 n=1 Tax=Juglans microcarpa x Juglans regia TaxID=2249226 RepID=UPI001B7DE1B9|nr:uncharacterized protein LOC121236577 [Juglans microcarpa x Juglans regia]